MLSGLEWKNLGFLEKVFRFNAWRRAQNHDPEILIHDTPFPLPQHLCRLYHSYKHYWISSSDRESQYGFLKVFLKNLKFGLFRYFSFFVKKLKKLGFYNPFLDPCWMLSCYGWGTTSEYWLRVLYCKMNVMMSRRGVGSFCSEFPTLKSETGHTIYRHRSSAALVIGILHITNT